ncbi:MAG: hypothetical protein AB7F32_05040 [Victivallaceae bacterium]
MRKIRNDEKPENIGDFDKARRSMAKTAAPGPRQPLTRGMVMTINEVMRDCNLSYNAVKAEIERGHFWCIRDNTGARILADSVIDAFKPKTIQNK